jgi:molybdate transport system ATP-binding protein
MVVPGFTPDETDAVWLSLRLLLMDEPLASLDARRRDEILPYIERLRDQASVPIVYVSNVVGQVTRLATTVVLISEGRVRAVRSVAEVMGRAELYPMVGRFEAVAVLAARLAAHDPRRGLSELAGTFGKLKVPRLEAPVGAALRVRIRARDVILATSPPIGTSALNVLDCRVEALFPIEEAALEVQLRLGGGVGDPAVGRGTRSLAGTRGLRPDQYRRDRPQQSWPPRRGAPASTAKSKSSTTNKA